MCLWTPAAKGLIGERDRQLLAARGPPSCARAGALARARPASSGGASRRSVPAPRTARGLGPRGRSGAVEGATGGAMTVSPPSGGRASRCSRKGRSCRGRLQPADVSQSLDCEVKRFGRVKAPELRDRDVRSKLGQARNSCALRPDTLPLAINFESVQHARMRAANAAPTPTFRSVLRAPRPPWAAWLRHDAGVDEARLSSPAMELRQRPGRPPGRRYDRADGPQYRGKMPDPAHAARANAGCLGRRDAREPLSPPRRLRLGREDADQEESDARVHPSRDAI